MSKQREYAVSLLPDQKVFLINDLIILTNHLVQISTFDYVILSLIETELQ